VNALDAETRAAEAPAPPARSHVRARVWRAVAPLAPFVAGAAIVAWMAIDRTMAKVGHAAATLDDAYIHFQYARAIAEGHPLRYQAGEPTTSGATSLLWPLLLAPFYALGLHGDAIVWAAWALSFGALAALAYEAHALTARLAGRYAAAGAGAMVLACGGFAWSAASGMEVVPFAWALARSARRASEWAENEEPRARRRQCRDELVALAWVATLLRPEGALAAMAIAIVLVVHPRSPARRERAVAAAALAAVVAVPLFLLLTTGSAASTTASVKLLVGNPYYRGAALAEGVTANARLLVGTLLDGGTYSAEFVPAGGAAVALSGLAAVAVLGARAGRRWRAALVIALALGMFVPCLYVTFLWNRLRYLWPFATGWLVGLACLARLGGDVCARVRPSWRVVTALASGAFAGMLAMRLEWTLDDVAASASGIDRQQVALGRWAERALPEDARIGVNDTGAIAYFGERRTFDVVGLTTRGEGRYWVAGAGSRLEHYERLKATEPSRLPTHFIVYPEWLGCDAVLGAPLFEATVTDATILGGQTMRAYVADYTRLGTGEAPWTPLSAPLDALDVADLESEEAHGYALLGARDGEEIARMGDAPDGRVVVDGGRTNRTVERFVARLPATPVRGVMRVETQVEGVRAHVRVRDREISVVDVPALEWIEIGFDVPAGLGGDVTPIEVRTEGGPLTTFHYWFADGRARGGDREGAPPISSPE
jgi:hypothetical protein